MRLTAMILIIPLFACAEPEPTASVTAYGPALYDRENQGRYLLGAGIDALPRVAGNYYSVSTVATRGTMAVPTSVIGSRVDTGGNGTVLGLTFTGAGGSGSLQVVGIHAATAGARERYDLHYRATSTATPVDVCPTSGAIAFTGRFERNGAHVGVPGQLTFSCLTGVASKCVDWGYEPPAFDGPGQDLWDVHEACTQMASATYCGNRVSYTREGTSIEIMDVLAIQNPIPPDRLVAPTSWHAWMLPLNQWPPARGTYYAEAIWPAEGPALCLSRTRWASLPLDPCVGALPDPRVDPNGRYCEDIPDDELELIDGLVWNNSLVNDLPFHTWSNGGDLVTTVRGFHDGVREKPPTPGMTYVSTAGFLLREKTLELTTKNLQELRYFCEPGTTRCVTTTVAPAGYTLDLGFEGYVLKIDAALPAGTIPLDLYQHGTDYVTATRSPGRNYTRLRTIGHIFK